MNTTSMIAAQIQTNVKVLSEYSAQWELAVEGIYCYRPNGTYYYRPILPSGKRTYRSLKTKNLKLAKEKYYSLQANNGNVAEARLMVEDILARYEQDRPNYQKSGSVRHCREFGPNDVDELHAAASLLFPHPNSVVLGFQLLSEAYTGLRTKEILAWGIDHFGTRTPDGKYVNVWRCKNQHHINPYVNVHEGLQALLEAYKEWKTENYSDSPHFFLRHCGGVVDKGALAHALRRITPKLKKKLTSHGMRAFYVLVRRSQGATDEQIAWEHRAVCIRNLGWFFFSWRAWRSFRDCIFPFRLRAPGCEDNAVLGWVVRAPAITAREPFGAA